jgi:hypothetical protein
MNCRLSRTNNANGTGVCGVLTLRSGYPEKSDLKEKNRCFDGTKMKIC